MKTIQEIQSLIEYNAKEAARKGESGLPYYKKSKINAFKKKITLLKQCKFYLETNPREDYVKQMQTEAYKHITSIDNNFGLWFKNNPQNSDKPLNIYRKLMGRNTYVAQAKTLDFLLK